VHGYAAEERSGELTSASGQRGAETFRALFVPRGNEGQQEIYDVLSGAEETYFADDEDGDAEQCDCRRKAEHHQEKKHIAEIGAMLRSGRSAGTQQEAIADQKEIVQR
jgi:hypothetical protein